MATSAYQAWHNAGEPWRAAQPVAEMKAKIIGTLGAGVASQLGTIGNDAHLLSDYPQDHTPFSYTAWPVDLPGYVVCALDVMHKPDLGLDCFAIFDYWLTEAKAGRMPWAKYLIWQGVSYDVRRNWAPRANSGHYDHIHLSVRSDWIDKSIGEWEPIDMTPQEFLNIKTSNGVSLNNFFVTMWNRMPPNLASMLDRILTEATNDSATTVAMSEAEKADLIQRIVKEVNDDTARRMQE